MKKTKKKFLSVLLALMMIISIIPMSNASVVFEAGFCGEELEWSYTASTQSLKISGTGEMYDYFYDYSPWSAHNSNIRNIIMCDGITSIGHGAFSNCTSITNIVIPDGVTEIGDFAFSNCSSLTNVTIPCSVISIMNSAFNECYNLTDVYYSGTEEQWNKIDFALHLDELFNATIHYNSTSTDNPSEPEGTQSDLYVFSDNMSMSYMVDDVIFFAVSQLNNGGYSIPEKLSLTFTDSSVVELIDIYDYNDIESGKYSANVGSFPEEFKKCNFIVLKAKKEGMTEFVLTNSDTKDTFKTVITVSEDEYSVLRADNTPTRVLHGEEYNYIINGMVVSDFKCNQASGGYNFKMNIYNQQYSLGVVEVYTSDGTLIKVEKINKFAPATTVAGTFIDGYYLLEDAFKGEAMTFKGSQIAEETLIDIFVPNNGYIRITNDSAVSTSCYLLNLFDAILSSGGIVSGTESLTEEQIDLVGKKAISKFISNTYYLETAKRFQENMKDMVAENVTETVLLSMIQQTGGMAKGLLMEIDLDFGDICKEALGTSSGIAEDVFTKVTGTYGKVLSGMMTVRKTMNFATQILDWTTTTNKQAYFSIMTPYKSDYDSGVLTSGDGIKVDTNGNVSSEVLLQTVRILKDDVITVELSTGEILNDYIVYNISLVKNGEEVQPDGTVTVYLNVPSGFGDKVSVSRQREDGSWQLIEATVKNGVISFEIEHFCNFVIGDVVGSFNIQTPSITTIRHKDGIKLHAKVEGTAPKGSYIEWTASNSNFKTEEINDGNSLQIVSDKNGNTTFTATLYSEDGEVLATDTIEMKSKAGFFDKISSFFRLLFGKPTIHEQ